MTILISIGILLSIFILFKIIEFLESNHPSLLISVDILVLCFVVVFIVYQARGEW